VSITQNSVEMGLIFEENGETYEQKDSYNPDTKEAVIAVPAHGDYPATKFIMQGKSSDSPVAGKMIVSTEAECSFEDIPDEIAPENMIKENISRRKVVTRQTKEVKVYRIQSNTRRMTEEEQENLSESMKTECAGKTVMVSSIETVDEDEFLARSDYASIFNSRLKRVNTSAPSQKELRNGCNNQYYGCAYSTPSRCVRWTYVGHDDFQPESGDTPLVYHLLGGSENYCTRCCRDPNTVFPQCGCISNEKTFSTAFAISRFWSGSGVYDCIKRSNYCKWSNAEKISGCNYVTEGSCIQDSPSCKCNLATQEECNAQP